MDNLSLGAEFDVKAPWNEEDIYCPECSSDVEIWDSGTFGKHTWTSYKCPECGYIINNEPDYD
jgi:predicted RNA-binding Zn-ribbon protein involved in translation (DUF1610 family)